MGDNDDLPVLDPDLTNSITMCVQIIFNQILTQNSSTISTIVIRFRNDDIEFGKMCAGSFKPTYYFEFEENVQQLINNCRILMRQIWERIKTHSPQLRLRGFLLHFNNRQRKINICRQIMGDVGIDFSKLFKTINIDE